MSTKTLWESFEAKSGNVVERVKQIVHEGNVRRIVVKRDGSTVAEFPLTAGVVGVVLAPVLAALGALVAVMKDCTIEVERSERDATEKPDQAVTAQSIDEAIDEQC